MVLKLFRQLAPKSGPWLPRLGLAHFGGAVTMAGLQLAIMVSIRELIDGIGVLDTQQLIQYLAAVFGAITCLAGLGSMAFYYVRLYATKTGNSLRGSLLAHITGADPQALARRARGDLLARLGSDVVKLEPAYTMLPEVLLGGILSASVAGAYLVTLHPVLLLYAVVVSAVTISVNAWLAAPLKQLSTQIQARVGELSARLSFLVPKVADVKLLGIKRTAAAAVETTAAAGWGRSLQLARHQGLLDAAGTLFALAGQFGFIAFGSFLATRGHLTVGGVISGIDAIGRIMRFMYNITRVHNQLRPVLASGERITEVFAIPPGRPGPRLPADGAGRPAIELADVSVSLGGQPILADVSLSLAGPLRLAVVGHNASGKTTLLKTMAGLIQPDSGAVALRVHPDLAGPALGYVPQEPRLLSLTIGDNIRIVRPAQADPDARMADALRVARAQGFVAKLEHGLDTMLGETGYNLSQGQRQRLAIARAVYSDAPVLMLDEATSALDADTERRIMADLVGLDRVPLLVFITHNPALLDLADQVLFIHDGRTRLFTSPAAWAASEDYPSWRAAVADKQRQDQPQA